MYGIIIIICAFGDNITLITLLYYYYKQKFFFFNPRQRVPF